MRVLISCFLFSLQLLRYLLSVLCVGQFRVGGAQETAKGINNGIIYLMAIPYLLVVFVGYQILGF